MCTLSIIPVGQGFRVVVNRDEAVTRPLALPPAWRDLGPGVRAIWPTDPQGGGTWVGASTRGMVAALLNATASDSSDEGMQAPPAPPARPLSRGGIVPVLLSSAGPREALALLAGMPLDRYPAFRVVLASVGGAGGVGGDEGGADGWGIGVHEVRWDRRSLHAMPRAVAPACFASSGLGDELVQRRVGLFREMVAPRVLARADDAVVVRAQDQFHRHAWAGLEHLSVRMCRPGVQTVSITTYDVLAAPGSPSGWDVRVAYEPIEPQPGALAPAPPGTHA